MAEELESLLQKIQDEAVTKAEQIAQEKIGAAEQRAAEIIAEAKRKAEQMIADAEQRGAQIEQNGATALEQAARNLLIYLRTAIKKHFEALYAAAVPEIVGIEQVQEILIRLATASAQRGVERGGVRVFVNDEDYRKLSSFFLQRFQEQAHEGVDLHPLKGVKAGFRVCFSEEDVTYDFTDKTIVAMLAELVNPMLEEILEKAASGAPESRG
jgi:V/A-type H+-transporting ATPase subunit E